ncbi:MAG TPA: hypothetical protein PK580_05875 [Nitrosomonas halophila]|nr:hypothetical protein [Nitrosomonas halophila]
MTKFWRPGQARPKPVCFKNMEMPLATKPAFSEELRHGLSTAINAAQQ